MKPKSLFLLLPTLAIAFWFRVYRLVDHFGLAFDQNLAAWIVKDIVVDKHLRLIGQLTSTDGIFIGPLYYYLQIPFFLLLKMDIKAILILPIILGIITTFSYYYVFKSIFNQKVGLIGSLLHACLLSLALLDRWTVPTVTTAIWSIWYLWCLNQVLKGHFKTLIIQAVLISLIWHVQLSLVPLIVLPVMAILLSPQLPKISTLFQSLIALFLTSTPLFLFELRHNFSQTKAFTDALIGKSGHGEVGIDKLKAVLLMVNENISNIFFPTLKIYPFLAITVLLGLWLLVSQKKLLEKKLNLILITWTVLMILSFSLNNKTISQYYFHNLNVIYILILSLSLSWLVSKAKLLGLATLFLIVLFNISLLIKYPYNDTGYNEKTKIVSFIKENSIKRGFSCIAVSFITNPGEDMTYRYLLWYYKIRTTTISSKAPIYTIVMPWQYAEDSIKVKYGKIGVITPPNDNYDPECKQDLNTTTDLFNFVK